MDDDDVIAAHEEAFAQDSAPRPPNRRGFWIMITAIGVTSALVVGGIFANRPLVSAIGRAEHDLRLAEGRALGIERETGTWAGATPAALAVPGDSLTLVAGSVVAKGPGQVSVYASSDGWAAATEARRNACFYIAVDAHSTVARYGGGTVCSGEAAFRLAHDTAW